MAREGNLIRYTLVLLAACAVASAAAPKGLSTSDWNSIRSEHQRHRQAAAPVEGGWRARNYQQNWSVDFDGKGFQVSPVEGSWRWGLKLGSYGYAGQERPVGGPKPAADVEKFSYQWDSLLREWYINGDTFEHGYTLAARPGRGTGLRLHLQVLGSLQARVASDGRSIAFVERRDGPAVVNYSGLKVTDAAGRVLTARFEAEGRGFRLEIDDSDARYPITVDPIAQQAYLKASNVDAGDGFGWSVAVDGNIAVVGAPFESGNGSSPLDNSLSQSGAAYIFFRVGASWLQSAYLKASNPDAFDKFGSSVAINALTTTVVVGAPGEDGSSPAAPNNSSPDAGAAYAFDFSAGVWLQRAYLKARSFPQSLAHFGAAVAIDQDTIIVGEPDRDLQCFDCGSPGGGLAHVFTRSAGVWDWEATFASPTMLPTQNFGISVSISGDTAVVGSWRDYLGIFRSAAYVYFRTGTSWGLQATLRPTNQDAFDFFGLSVAISGDTIVVGAPKESSNGSSPSDNSMTSAGAAYIFKRSNSPSPVWNQIAYLKSPTPVTFQEFGHAVAVSGDTLVVGAAAAGAPKGSDSAYVFGRDAGGLWTYQSNLTASNRDPLDQFGYSVAVSGGTVIVGAPNEASDGSSPANNSAAGAGAAYVFAVVNPTVSVTIDTSPSGIPFSTSGMDCAPGNYTTPQTLQWIPGSSCTVSVPLTYPLNATGLRFNHWEDNSTSGARIITAPTASANYVAAYTGAVTVSVSPPGGGSVFGPGMPCATICSFTFDAAASPVFTAAPNPPYLFIGWSVDCTGTGSCAPVINSNKNITANFAPPGTGTLLTAALGAKKDLPGWLTSRVWPLVFTNSGGAPATDVRIESFTLTPTTSNSGCSPVVTVPTGIVGSVPGPGTLTVDATIDFFSCSSTARFKLFMIYSANSGAILQTLTLYNQIR